MNHIKLGVCEFCLPCPGPLAIRMAHDAGFQGMQLGDLGGAARRYPFTNPYVQQRYLEAAAENHITFQAMHLQALFNSRYMLESPHSSKGEIARISLKNAAESCRQMNIPVIMVTGTMIANQEQLDNLCSALQYGLAVSQDNGVQLVMETDLTPQQFLALRERVGQGLKLCFDTMNPTVYGIGQPHELIRTLGLDVIDHFHAKDCVPNENGYFTKYTTPYRLIGQGSSGFSACAQVIRELGYSGWVISETFYDSPDFQGDYVELARQDVAALRQAFSVTD